MRHTRAYLLLLVISATSPGLSFAQTETEAESATVIANGKQVSLEYTLVLEDGSTVASNVGKPPLLFTHGEQKILPALETALEGLQVDETKSVTLAPEQAYGPVNPEAFRDVDPSTIPEEARTAGTMLVAQDSDGNSRPVRVHEVRDDNIVLDFNHPLAGKTLTFNVRVVAIQ
jgi:FKBP-type peptidyl-prolyl cis-trans isomerase 2